MTLDLFTHELPPHGASRRSDPETSKEAGRAMTGERLTKTQQIVLEYFQRCGPSTDETMEDSFYIAKSPNFSWRFTGSTLRSRRAELVRMGKLVDSGERKLNRGGKRCIVWRLK